jgi:YggT family protein
LTSFLVQFISVLANILYVALIGRVIISWLNVSPTNPIASVIYQVTEPILAPLRRVLPRVGMLDFSPMVAIFIIIIVQRVFVYLT